MMPVALILIATITVFALHMTYAALADHAARVGLKKATIRTSAGYPTQAGVETTVDGLFANDLLGDPTEVSLVREGAATVLQGDPVTVSVTYTLPAVAAAAGLVAGIEVFGDFSDALFDLSTVTRTARGRSE